MVMVMALVAISSVVLVGLVIARTMTMTLTLLPNDNINCHQQSQQQHHHQSHHQHNQFPTTTCLEDNYGCSGGDSSSSRGSGFGFGFGYGLMDASRRVVTQSGQIIYMDDHEYDYEYRERVMRQHLWAKVGFVWKECSVRSVKGVLTGCSTKEDNLQRVWQCVWQGVWTGGVVGLRQGLWVVKGMLSHAAEDFGGSSGASIGLG